MSGFRWLLLCFALLSFLTGCGEGGTEAVGSHHHVARTSGGAVALSYDERVAVVTNYSAGIVTVLSLKPERGLDKMVSKTTVLSVGADSEPCAAVIGADDNTAYVVLRKDQQVIRIDQLRQAPSVFGTRRAVGSEPTSIAISPTGKFLFVANFGDGTISKIQAEAFEDDEAIDLNQRLIDKQLLGSGLKSRAGLAHPRALVISDNGDQNDADEVLFATEFFSQPAPGTMRDIGDIDGNREGLVYATRLTGQAAPTIDISAVRDTGFMDSNDEATSCFPNQLYAAAIDNGRLYVTAMCTSPRGPLDKQKDKATQMDTPANYKTLLHPAVFVVDTAMSEERPDEGRLLTQVLQGLYDSDGDSADIRMPLIPNDIAFRAGPNGSHEAYVLAMGADAVFRLDYRGDGTLRNVGSEHHRYLGSLPAHGHADGIAITQRSSPAFGLTISDVTQEVSIIDVDQQQISKDRLASTGDDEAAAALRGSPRLEGRGLFATGLGVWSFKGQAWSSCESCHPGGLSDGVVWSFARGPRRTLSAANTYEKNPQKGKEPGRRLLLWGANVDEIHDVEVIARTVSGGTGAVLWQYSPVSTTSNDCRIGYDGKKMPEGAGVGLCKAGKPTSQLRNGLNGSLAAIVGGLPSCAPTDSTCDSAATEDWNEIDAFIRSLRLPRRPPRLNITHIEEGRKSFKKGGCASCHGGPQWTVSTLFYVPGDEQNGKAPAQPVASATSPELQLALGSLRRDQYTVPDTLAALNPAAKTGSGCPMGQACSTFRVSPADASDEAARKLLYGLGLVAGSVDPAGDAAKAAGGDQLRCALRNVGTYPTVPADLTDYKYYGVAPSGQPKPQEYRADMTLAQGKDGFGVPSLFGLALGAPYFHAGNARTLEELFDDGFALHHRNPAIPVDPDFLSKESEIDYLIEFLLSIDENSETEPVPDDMDFCSHRLPAP
jgi:hypothetical protein